ncbi:hypothetical protein BH11VER1_BH11VER1_22830 [soil metagenome]
MRKQVLAMISQQPPSFDRAIRVSRLLHVSAATLLCVLATIIAGAIIDIIHNGNSGYPNFWRQVRCPFGYLIVVLLLLHGAILGAMRQLSARAFAMSFVLILGWLILEHSHPITRERLVPRLDVALRKWWFLGSEILLMVLFC